MTDAAAIARVNVESWREAYSHVLSAGFLEAMSVDDMTANWTRTIGQRVVHVAELDGEVRGFSFARDSFEKDAPRPIVLALIYQLKSMHCTGSGQALLDAALGVEPAYLWVAEQNPRAIRFYERNGFNFDGTRTTAERWENLVELRMVR